MKGPLYVTTDKPIRFTVDGTTPGRNRGHLLYPGDWLTLDRPGEIKKFRKSPARTRIHTFTDVHALCRFIKLKAKLVGVR